MTRAAPSGPTRSAWNSSTASRVIAATVEADPAVGLEARSYGAHSVAIISLAARCGAEARSCSISASRATRSRRTSSSGNAGSLSASRRSSRATGRCRRGTSMSTMSAPSLTPAEKAMPCRSSSAANSSLECRMVPSSRSEAMSEATSISRGSSLSAIDEDGGRDDILSRTS